MSSMEWETPQDFFDTLNAEFHFTLDVCATSETAKCKYFYSSEDDGLIRSWQYERCWLNPPYDRNIGLWLKRAYEATRWGILTVCLIQGRSTDTKWWHDYVMRSSEIRFIKNRLHFGLNGNFSRANISSVVVIFLPFCTGPPKTKSINMQGIELSRNNKITPLICKPKATE